jgi:hypothetical protein
MTIVHVAAIPQEKEQRCVRCCRKILDIDPVTEATYPALAYVAKRDNGETSIQETDAGRGQRPCRKPGPTGKDRE